MSTAAVERVGLDPASPWWGEHRSRYHFAAGFVTGGVVLDLACGSGLGAPILLGGGAAHVIGVDISPESIVQARRLNLPRLDFCLADGTRLPLADASIDVVVSFETLEHVPAFDSFVRELRRVLRPDGRLILSTPNALHTRPVAGRPRNPFHVHEFTPDELVSLLAAHFPSVRLLGQRTHPSFGPCPYWELDEHLPRDAGGRLRVISWKLHNRLPPPLRERLALALYRRSFFPGEHDFVFAPEGIATGHVLLAVCGRGTP